MKIIYRTPWSDKEHDRPKNKLSLHRNENCDASLIEIFEKRFLPLINGNVISRYPDIKGAYLALARMLGVSSKDIYLTGGSEQAIKEILSCHSRIEKKSNKRALSFPCPTFGLVEVYARLLEFQRHPVKYRLEGRNFLINYPDLLKGDPDVIYLASPDNPTGHTIADDELDALCRSGKKIILDLAYLDFIGDPQEKFRYYASLYKKHKNLYLVGSFSKSRGAAGLRIGYVISQPLNIARIREAKPQFEINSVACEFVKYFSRHKGVFKSSVSRLKQGKKMLEKTLESRGHAVIPASGNFTLARFSASLEKYLSRKSKVAVISICGSKFIRITAADPKTIAGIL